uniref:Uncharacterized protein n=1 Tax=viral metagenome TaxID=1070528 RepID=A0A6M3J0E0_9ZZZZ
MKIDTTVIARDFDHSWYWFVLEKDHKSRLRTGIFYTNDITSKQIEINKNLKWLPKNNKIKNLYDLMRFVARKKLNPDFTEELPFDINSFFRHAARIGFPNRTHFVSYSMEENNDNIHTEMQDMQRSKRNREKRY